MQACYVSPTQSYRNVIWLHPFVVLPVADSQCLSSPALTLGSLRHRVTIAWRHPSGTNPSLLSLLRKVTISLFALAHFICFQKIPFILYTYNNKYVFMYFCAGPSSLYTHGSTGIGKQHWSYIMYDQCRVPIPVLPWVYLKEVYYPYYLLR